MVTYRGRAKFRSLATAFVFFLQAEDGIRDDLVTGVQTCALPISPSPRLRGEGGERSEPGEGASRSCSTLTQVGRASCRERVEISVVAASLKKKKREASAFSRVRWQHRCG